MFNKKHTDDAKKKVSEANKGKTPWNKGIPRDNALKEAVSKANKGKTAWNKGKKRTEEEREKMREGWRLKKEKGFVNSNKGSSVPDSKKVRCEHCNKLFTKSNYKRWHGNNCKEQ